jgi:NDP-4-keto-2,6-dideoxyhexose 3-C-methyltransferase
VKCRICGNNDMYTAMEFGVQKLTGVFPVSELENQRLSSGQITLVKCNDEIDENNCGLLQIKNSFDSSEMYGDNYGYRSGLNLSMVQHLTSKINKIIKEYSVSSGDLVVDIGSNDATSLRCYPSDVIRVGIDPTGEKFKEYYEDQIMLIPDFFSADVFYKNNLKKAKVVTSFSMFYDLENPVEFARDISSILTEKGVWVFEQSYLPLMIDTNSFDTACHEHVEYYSLKAINHALTAAGLKIVEHEFNSINGGSISIVAAKVSSELPCDPKLKETINKEFCAYSLHKKSTYLNFMDKVNENGVKLKKLLNDLKDSGVKVAGLGASTKGNVLLQYYGISDKDLQVIGEVNSEKYGKYTPGSLIPIISEDLVLESDFEYLLILPWHFKDFFINNKKFKGKKLIFPLPNVHIVEL